MCYITMIMRLLRELAIRFLSPAEELFWDSKKRIEASVGFPPTEDGSGNSWQVRPAETMWDWPIGDAMKVFDAASLHAQRITQAILGLVLPDIRFRVITTGESDGYAGTHFGTLTEATRLAQEGFDREMGIINGSARNIDFPELPAPR